ncbi:MAG TPA: hypothetical protein VG146_12450 [Verrucomicrobiae bacterium]|nr:hypothetical protein [Verrucomicrobiae bacterium]
MNPHICICCGEPMVQEGNGLSRNPNVCASCSSLADGKDEQEPSPLWKPSASDPGAEQAAAGATDGQSRVLSQRQ